MNRFLSGLSAIAAALVFSAASNPVVAVGPRVVYGTDDRIDIYQETDPQHLAAAESVCLLMLASDLTDNGNGSFTINTFTDTTLCPGEPYSTQPVSSGYCTAFVAADDILATAGSCADPDNASIPIASIRAVFGFEMLNASTANVIIPATDIYSVTEIVARSGDNFALLRVDHSLVTSTRKPLGVRRVDAIPDNTRVGLIGYTSATLPEKIAFGFHTRVRDISNGAFFNANLDAFFADKGSPVFNQETMLVEGIFVRSAARDGDDYVFDHGCFHTDHLADTSAIENILRIPPILVDYPDVDSVNVSKRYLRCGGEAEFHVHDPNWPDEDLAVTVTSQTTGDSEVVTLSDPDLLYDWTGTIPVAAAEGAPTANNGTLEVANGEKVVLTYTDLDPAGTFTDTVTVDCVAPVINSVVVQSTTVENQVPFAITGQEPTEISAAGGIDCGTQAHLADSELDINHQVVIDGLIPCTDYFFTLNATDRAGNVTTLNNSGDCYPAMTLGRFPHDNYFENFDPEGGVIGWSIAQDPGSDNRWALRASAFAPTNGFAYSFEAGTESDARAYLVSPPLPHSNVLEFYHTYSFEKFYDGGYVEITTNGGTNWTDLGPFIVQGGYNATIQSFENEINPNPSAGHAAWGTGTIAPMTLVRANITSFFGSEIRVRFVFTSNDSVASDGWQIDDVKVFDTGCESLWTLY